MNDLQGDQWLIDRAGMQTASRLVDLLTRRKDGGYIEARSAYMRELAFERIAKIPRHSVNARTMQWGKTNEGHALAEYEVRTGLSVIQQGFVRHPEIEFVGASPDGFVGTDGGVEVKCPHNEAIHLKTWLEGTPEEHIPQIQGNLWCSRRKWWDFLSFDPRLGNHDLSLFRERHKADPLYHQNLETECWQFELELRQMVDKLIKRGREIWEIEEIY